MADLDGKLFRKEYVNGRKALVPCDQFAEEWLDRLPKDRDILIVGRRPRNSAHHRLAFGLFRIVIQNDPEERWANETALLLDLKRATGHGEETTDGFTGEIVFHPKSIAFSAMDQDAFREWFDQAINILAKNVLCVPPQTLCEEVFSMVDPKAKPWKIARNAA